MKKRAALFAVAGCCMITACESPIPGPVQTTPGAKTFLIMNNDVNKPIPGVDPVMTGATWMERHADIGMTYGKSSKQSVLYVNWWDNSAPQLEQTFEFLERNQRDLENAFLHYSRDALIPVQAGGLQCSGVRRWTAMKENRFPVVLLDANNQRVPSRSEALGQALSFSGAGGYADLGPVVGDAVTRTGEISIEAWIRPALPGASPVPTSILSGYGFPGLWIDHAHQLVMEVKASNVPLPGDPRIFSPRFPMSKTAATWYHVIGTASNRSQKVQLFVNGVAVGAKIFNAATPFSPPTSNLFLARDIMTQGRFYRGEVDEVRIYDRELSPTEASARFTNALALDHLVAQYDFEESGDEFLLDRSNSQYRATLHGRSDITNKAYGELSIPGTSVCSREAATPVTAQIQMIGLVNESIFIGHYGKFDEVNLNVTSPPTGGWRGAFEYWDGTAWMPFGSISDATGGFIRAGKISFRPPGDWVRTAVSGRSRYWVRLRTVQQGIAPVFTSSAVISNTYEWKGTSGISGRAYARNPAGTDLVVPGWDSANDRNGDGYVDSAEFASLVNPQATARFKYQARVPAAYFSNRWLSNPADPDYLAAIGEFSRKSVDAHRMDGVFVDNTVGRVADHFAGEHPILELMPTPSPDLKTRQNSAYAGSVARGLASLKRAINENSTSPRVLLTNGTFYNPSIADADRIMAEVDGTFIEQAITYVSQFKDNPVSLRVFDEKIRKYSDRGKKLILHAAPDPDIYGNPAYQGERDQIYSLARYYLTSTSYTYFDYQDGSLYINPWNNWFDAIRSDIGTPTGSYRVREFAPSGTIDPSRNLIGRASFEEYSLGTVFPWSANPGQWMRWLREGQVPDTANTCRVSSPGMEGANSLLIEQQSATGNRCAAVQFISGLKPNTSYTLLGSVKLENFQSLESTSALIFFYVPGSGTLATATLSGTTLPWTRINAALTTPADLTGARIYAHANKGTGKVSFDQLGLYEGDFTTINVLERTFSKGLVLLRPSRKALANHRIPVDETPIQVPLAESYCPVRADGTLGTPVRSVSLAEFQGFIGVKCPAP